MRCGLYRVLVSVACLAPLSLLATSISYAQGRDVTFNSGFLVGASSQSDLSRFSNGNGVEAGTYMSDVYVNGLWRGRYDINIDEVDGGSVVCLDEAMLIRLGFNRNEIRTDLAEDGCHPISAFISGEDGQRVSANFDLSRLRVDIQAPQIYILSRRQNYVDPEFWDEGIPAATFGYNFNTFHFNNTGGGRRNESTSFYLGLNSNFHFNGWSLRSQGNLSWQDNGSGGASWQNNETVLQRGIANIQSEVAIGEFSTTGEFFDGIRVRGARLRSDDRMLPDGSLNYAPDVRGVANTNALVTVRQNGSVIHRENVTPGPFAFRDLTPSSYGNELEVTVEESDGQVNVFYVPYASITQLLRPGYSRYSYTVGEIDSRSYDYDPVMMEYTYHRGLTNLLTGYAGFNAFSNYRSAMLGGALNTSIGAVSLDVTRAETELETGTEEGNSIRLGYNRMFDTGTNIVLAAYRHNERGFYSAHDALAALDFEERGTQQRSRLDPQKNNITATLNQQLPDQWGSVYLNASVADYWDRSGTQKRIQASYNNRWNSLTYQLNVTRFSSNYWSDDDTRIYASVSHPFGRSGARSNTVTASTTYYGSDYQASSLGVSGGTGGHNAATYNVTANDSEAYGQSLAVGGSYLTPYNRLNANASWGTDSRQASFGASGALAVHEGGVTAGPQYSDNMVLVEAPGAKGATLPSSMGTKVDGRGYALVSNARPYRVSNISIDPVGSSDDVQLLNTIDTVTPYSGTLTRVRFETELGRTIIVRVAGAASLPFGNEVLDQNGDAIGVVGQGRVLHLRTDQQSGTVSVETREGICRINYSVSDAQWSESGVLQLDGVCE